MTRHSTLLAGLLALLLTLFVPAVAAQSSGKFQSAFGQSANKGETSLFSRVEGDRVRVAIVVEIQPGWHLYHTELGHPEAIGLPTEVELSGAGIEWEAPKFPEPHRIAQPFPDVTALTHEGRIVITAVGRLAAGATGEDVGAKLTGQTCEDDGTCVLFNATLVTQGRGEDALFPAPKPKRKSLNKAEATLYTRVEGSRVTAAIEIVIDEGWHLYHSDLGDPDATGLPTSIEMSGAGVEWGEPDYPAPHRVESTFDDTWTWNHDGTIVVLVEGELEAGATGEDIGATIRGLTCDEASLCVPYSETLVSSGRGEDALFIAHAAGEHEDEEGGESGADGLWGFLLSAVGWGLITLLMPCTYPMIPITISFFTKQAADRKGSALPLSIAYGLGIVVVFVVIGVAFGSVIIPFATHPVTNLVIGALFTYFALVLFGVVNLQPPKVLLQLAGKASQTGGYLGVFLMGTTLVITSFTCTAPFVGTLLATGAEGGGVGRIALGMGVFGLTMALPFVALSMVPGKMQAIPRSGEWMNTLKVFLGFIELAAALKFLSNTDLSWGWNLISREVFLGIWILIFLASAVFLFGRMPGKRAQPGKIRVFTGFGMLSLTGYCTFGLFGGKLDRLMVSFVPPYSGGILLPWLGDQEHLYVADDYDLALEQARAENKLLLVNFTGHT